jgi:hypothetical protein
VRLEYWPNADSHWTRSAASSSLESLLISVHLTLALRPRTVNVQQCSWRYCIVCLACSKRLPTATLKIDQRLSQQLASIN